jgi:plastocyanin
MQLQSSISILIIGLFFSLLTQNSITEREVSLSFYSGSIEGVAVLAPKNRPVRFGGGLYSRPAPTGSSQASSDSILVVLRGINSSGQPMDKGMKSLNQKEQQFQPTILPVPLNGTVRIMNSDPVYHNVFSLTSPHKFDVGRRPKGEHFDVTFEKPGVVDVFCDIHSNMHAIIYVLPEGTTSWTKIKSGESFSFSGLSDGSYEISLYALGYKESVSQVSIEGGNTIQAGTITLNP